MANEEIKGMAVELAMNDSNFNAGMKNLKQQLGVIDSGFKASVAGVKNWGSTLDGMKANADALGQKMTIQKQIIQAYTEQMEKSKTALDKNVDTMTRLKAELGTAKSAYEQNAASVGKNDEATKKLKTTVDELSAKFGHAESAVVSNQSSIQGYTIQVNQATAKLNSMESELKQTGTAMSNYGKETDQAKEKTSFFGDILKANLTGAAIISALKAIGNELKNLANGALLAADKIATMSEVTGLSTDRLQELQYIGTKLDVEFDTMATSQTRLTKAMFAAKDGTGAQADAFKALKVDALDPVTGAMRDARVVMNEAFAALNNYGNETERDALAMTIFGKSAMDLNPLIKAGSDELQNLADQAHAAGAVMSEEAVAALDYFKDAVDAAKLSITAFIGEALAPLVEEFGAETVDSLTKSTQALNEVSTAADNTVASNAAAGEVAQDYLDRLEELESQGLSTAEAQKEYSDTVAKLNALIPGLNLIIDEQTGLIKGNTDALKDNIVAWKEAAMAQALQERYKDIVAAQANAMAELAENEVKHTKAMEEKAAYGSQLDIIYRQIAEALGYSGEQADAMVKSLRESENIDLADWSARAGVELSSLSNNVFNLTDKAVGLRGGFNEAEQSEKTFATAIEVGKAAVKRNADEVVLAEEAMRGLLGITEESTAAVKINTKAIEDAAEANKINADAARTLSGDIDKCNAALAEQTENGKLSAVTILDLTDAGYGAVLQIDKETGAVRLDKEAYNNLTKAKLEERLAAATEAQRKAQTDAIVSESLAASLAALGLYDLAKARYAEAAAAKKQAPQEEANIKAINALIAGVGKYTVSAGAAGKASETAADKASKAFDKSVTQIGRALDLGEIDQEEYWKQYSSLMDKHLRNGSDDWENANFTLLKGQKALNDDLIKETEKTYDTMSKRLEDIKGEYDKALSDIQTDIDKMASDLAGFGDTATFSESDSGDVTAALEDWNAQTQAIVDFGTALDSLKTKGIPESLLSEIASMDTNKGIALANTLLGLSDTEWTAQMAAWDAKQQAAKLVAEAYYKDDIDTLNATLTTAVTDLQSDMTKAGLKLGGNIVDGLVMGIKDGTIDVQLAMEAVIAAAEVAAKKKGEMSSPSKLFNREVGAQISAGVAKGITGGTPGVKSSMAVMMDGVIAQAKALKLDAASAITSLTGQISSSPAINPAVQNAAAQTAEMGAGIVNGIAGLMNNSNGGTFIIQLVVDSKVLAQTVFDPLKEEGKRRGE